MKLQKINNTLLAAVLSFATVFMFAAPVSAATLSRTSSQKFYGNLKLQSKKILFIRTKAIYLQAKVENKTKGMKYYYYVNGKYVKSSSSKTFLYKIKDMRIGIYTIDVIGSKKEKKKTQTYYYTVKVGLSPNMQAGFVQSPSNGYTALNKGSAYKCNTSNRNTIYKNCIKSHKLQRYTASY